MTEKVKVVIEIPKERYEWIKEHKGRIDYTTTEMLYSRVRRGSLLNDVLYKIKAEIYQLPSYVAKFAGGSFAIHIDKEKVLQIIDKYKTESED